MKKQGISLIVVLFLTFLFSFRTPVFAEVSDPVVNPINDKQQLISGTAFEQTSITAFVGNQEIVLKSYNTKTGYFEFYPSDLLKENSEVKIIFEKDGIQNIIFQKVQPAAVPSKPKVNPISNKNTYLTGTAEPYSTVYITINKKTTSIKLKESNSFTYSFKNNKALSAGTIVSVYVVDKAGRKSGTVSLKVLDKIPPAIPKVETITNQSFSIKGTAEKKATIIINKNQKRYAMIKVGSTGKFMFRMPLQKAKTQFEIYAVDPSGNKSKVKKIIVKSKKQPSKKLLSSPIIRQMPELPRGCEVTSLAMLLGDAGVKVNKMTLATKVKKDPTPFQIKNGKTYFGNPYNGFVGNMYTFNKPGLGVYHGPIAKLASSYLPNRIIDLTGSSFNTIQDYVSAGHPVWVVTTSWFSYVSSNYWTTWHTPTGKVRITYKEHSVLITGFDKKYVYFNDPLDGKKNKKKPLKSFIQGWNQFGNQAISYY
ncbi:C39 family peptidase [Heyndrickxia sp. NPDC080065]|uniref:C39 family peptidase n=1 Tax=Heyndrickxia sp. NPDC080065 TaxID=3390568 RepID=UPI003D01E5C8